MSNRASRIFKSVLLGSVILGLVAVAGYFYWQYQQVSANNPEKELHTITQRLRKFMDLPESPLPTLATVTEKEKLRQQPFFQKAENGDKVLIYLSEGIAILYRPATQKVIAVGPVRQAETGTTQTESDQSNTKTLVSPPEESQPVSITIYNGSTVAGAARATESQLADLTYDYTVVARANAARTTYGESIVVDVAGNLTTQAQQLAELLGATIASLPEGEESPEVGGLLVIIGGADKPAASSSASIGE